MEVVLKTMLVSPQQIISNDVIVGVGQVVDSDRYYNATISIFTPTGIMKTTLNPVDTNSKILIQRAIIEV